MAGTPTLLKLKSINWEWDESCRDLGIALKLDTAIESLVNSSSIAVVRRSKSLIFDQARLSYDYDALIIILQRYSIL